MLLFMFAERSLALELIDTGDYTPDEYADCLHELRLINRYIGEYHALRSSFFVDVRRAGLKRFSLLDLGAGSGELLRLAARFARENSIDASLTGLELNPGAAKEILAETRDFSNITAVRANAMEIPFADGAFDYVMCSLFTHHLKDEDIIAVLREMRRVARRGIYVIDLHRHPIAYFLYTTVGRLFLKNRLVRHDGALSILRAFKPTELVSLAKRAGLTDATVKRRFPFRLILRADAKDE
jgi:ubiquinone/menaquinone biosynthesis C-methylase UbiE